MPPFHRPVHAASMHSAVLPAKGDIVYVSFASQAAKDRAAQVLGSDGWRALSANRDSRVFIVNDEDFPGRACNH